MGQEGRSISIRLRPSSSLRWLGEAEGAPSLVSRVVRDRAGVLTFCNEGKEVKIPTLPHRTREGWGTLEVRSQGQGVRIPTHSTPSLRSVAQGRLLPHRTREGSGTLGFMVIRIKRFLGQSHFGTMFIRHRHGQGNPYSVPSCRGD